MDEAREASWKFAQKLAFLPLQQLAQGEFTIATPSRVAVAAKVG